MEFCQECDNMLYTKVITEETKSGLVYYCLNCDQNYDNIKLVNDKFNLNYIKKIQYKIENIPLEFFFAICGEKEITNNQEKIKQCKLNANYKLINRYINIEKAILVDEINNFNIDTKRPYVYIIQLNKWYKQQ